jgi:dTDP-4-amino-4,6-dideoxygalactose transaminase
LNLIQLRRSVKNRAKRPEKGLLFLQMLKDAGFADNYYDIANHLPSFVKFYIVSKTFNSDIHIRSLNSKGIEAMHLEHKHNDFYQHPFNIIFKDYPESQIDSCKVYLDIHNHIISLPFHEDISRNDMLSIISSLKKMGQKV